VTDKSKINGILFIEREHIYFGEGVIRGDIVIKRIKILGSFIFFIIIFILFFSLSLSAQNPGVLNFHSIKANGQNQIEMITLALPLIDENTEKIFLRLNNKFFVESNGRKINSDSLSIITAKKEHLLKNKNIEIPIRDNLIKHNNKLKVLLQINILIKPEDPPGRYQNELIITQKNQKGEFVETEIPVEFKVEPWIKMFINTDFYEISQTDFDNNNLESIIPGQIEIRSNCPWKLFVNGDQSEIISKGKLNLIGNSDEEIIEINQEELKITEEKILFASANLRKNDHNKRLIIFFKMDIEEFQKVKAGRYKFPVYFQLEIFNGNF